MTTEIRISEITPPIHSKSLDRQSNFELLRILAIILVLVIHADFWSNSDPTGAESAYTQSSGLGLFARCFFSSLSSVCVNLFVLVSGWFSIRVSVKGSANLFFTYLYVLVGVIAVGVAIGISPMSLSTIYHCASFDVYWFFWSYLLLFALSPVLNTFVQNTTQKTHRNVLICFYLYQTLSAWLVPVGKGFESGLSFIPFIGLYLLAQYLRKYPETSKNISTTKLILSYLILLFGVTVVKYVNVPFLSSRIVSYMCPTTILMGVLLILIFSRIKIQSRFVNLIASSAFTVYLFHGHMLLFRPYYRTTIKEIYESYNGFSCLGLVAVTCLATFILSVIIDQPRRYVWSKLKSKL